MEVINLTPHDVDICDAYGRIIKTYKASGKVARISSYYNEECIIDGVPVVSRQVNDVIDLPEEQSDIMYIVSNLVLDYCYDRMDLLAPVKQVKINGRIVGCRAFMSNR